MCAIITGPADQHLACCPGLLLSPVLVEANHEGCVQMGSFWCVCVCMCVQGLCPVVGWGCRRLCGPPSLLPYTLSQGWFQKLSLVTTALSPLRALLQAWLGFEG